MRARSQIVNYLRRRLRPFPAIKQILVEADRYAAVARNASAAYFPILIRPEPRQLTVAITAQCNLRCLGCRYGRDFMAGHSLSLRLVRNLLDDAAAAGVDRVRLYGGEPLLHPGLPKMIEHSNQLGLNTYVTTNGLLLGSKIGELYSAGLRDITVGFYGAGRAYDQYVQRSKAFAPLESGIAAVKSKYGMSVDMQLNFLLMRPSCNLEAIHTAWQFAERYDMGFRVDLIHYSLPYFTEGDDRQLQFTEADRIRIEEVTQELVRLKQSAPARFRESLLTIRSIPDWLLKGPNMKIPCDAYRMIWVGADGTVQLCYVTFKLGNLHESRLREMLFTEKHKHAARDAFQLRCPNCHCGDDNRIQMHLGSRIKYGFGQRTAEPGDSIGRLATESRPGI